MTARSTARETARGRRVRAWQKAEAVKLRPAISVTWFKAVLPWKTWMRNQWMMAAGVKRAEMHQVCPGAAAGGVDDVAAELGGEVLSQRVEGARALEWQNS